MGELVRIDLAVVIRVEHCEESLGIGLHLIGRQGAVTVAVGLVKPGRERVFALCRWARKARPSG